MAGPGQSKVALLAALPLLCQLAGAGSPAGRGPQPDPAPPAPPVLSRLGVAYDYAQQVRWLDDHRFIVGRWDGTISLFRQPRAGDDGGPRAVGALHSVSGEAVQMLAVAGAGLFATSNDEGSLTLWRLGAASAPAAVPRLFRYDPRRGPARSGLFVTFRGRRYLLTGHRSGFVLVWAVDSGGRGLRLQRELDLRSPEPCGSPHPLFTVRALVRWSDHVVVSAAEDGDLCMIDLATGAVLARRRYNPAARRGINDLAIDGDRLLAVNCSVGPGDKNAWLFRLSPAGFEMRASINLKKDPALAQVYAFGAAQATSGGQAYAFVTTAEGLLWTIPISRDDRFQEPSALPVDFPLGDALAYAPQTRTLVVAGSRLHLFKFGAALPPAPPRDEE